MASEQILGLADNCAKFAKVLVEASEEFAANARNVADRKLGKRDLIALAAEFRKYEQALRDAAPSGDVWTAKWTLQSLLYDFRMMDDNGSREMYVVHEREEALMTLISHDAANLMNEQAGRPLIVTDHLKATPWMPKSRITTVDDVYRLYRHPTTNGVLDVVADAVSQAIITGESVRVELPDGNGLSISTISPVEMAMSHDLAKRYCEGATHAPGIILNIRSLQPVLRDSFLKWFNEEDDLPTLEVQGWTFGRLRREWAGGALGAFWVMDDLLTKPEYTTKYLARGYDTIIHGDRDDPRWDKVAVIADLVNVYAFTDVAAGQMVDELAKLENLELNFARWRRTGEVPLATVGEHTFESLQRDFDMNPYAAFRHLDWLLSEPRKAKAALAGHLR